MIISMLNSLFAKGYVYVLLNWRFSDLAESSYGCRIVRQVPYYYVSWVSQSNKVMRWWTVRQNTCKVSTSFTPYPTRQHKIGASQHLRLSLDIPYHTFRSLVNKRGKLKDEEEGKRNRRSKDSPRSYNRTQGPSPLL